MSEVAAATPPAPAPTLLDALRQRLADASGPLTLKELAKGLPRPKKVRAAEFEASVPAYLDEDLRTGQVFKYGSGAKGSDRYWKRDEKHAIREAVLAAAATPLTVADLVKKSAGAVPKTDKGFAERVVRDLIGEDRLFEHPPKRKGGQPLFGAKQASRPHPLEVGKAKKDFEKLVAAARKLLDSVREVSATELLARLQPELGAAPRAPLTGSDSELGGRGSDSGLDGRILGELANVPVLSLADLRAKMRTEHQGPVFDATVLRLADEQRVIVHQDASGSRFTDADREKYVQDGGLLYTAISKGN